VWPVIQCSSCKRITTDPCARSCLSYSAYIQHQLSITDTPLPHADLYRLIGPAVVVIAKANLLQLVAAVRPPVKNAAVMSTTSDNGGFLSARASRALQPALPYFTAFVKAQERLWCPEDQEGYIVVTVAENKLSHEILRVSLPRTAALWHSCGGHAGMCLRLALLTWLTQSIT
jgi:hypothetical protein